MKRIFAILVSIVVLSISHEANAQNRTQNAVYLVSNPQTARWSYIETDSSGKHVTTVYNSVESIDGDAVNGKIKLRVEEVAVASPKDTIKSFMYYCFKNGEFMVDITSSFVDEFLGDSVDRIIKEKGADLFEKDKKEVLEEVKSTLFKISGEILGIPRYPKVGKLPDYEYQFKFSMMSMKILGNERSIVGKERIQTKAGSYDCFILEETISTKAMMMTDVEKTRSWYAYGIGLVKQITYDKKGNLISTMILNEVK